MFEILSRLYWKIILTIQLWWIINILHRTPSDFHRVLTEQGYNCTIRRSEPAKQILIYTRGTEEITLTLRK